MPTYSIRTDDMSDVVLENTRDIKCKPHNKDRHKTPTYNGSNKQQQNRRLRTDSGVGYRMGGAYNIFYWPILPKVMLLTHKHCY